MILITGGTGFVGREVVRELHALGQPMRLLARNPKKAEDLVRRYGCECVQGDVLAPGTIAPAMEGVSAVVHLVGIIAETRKASFEQAHVDATRNVIHAAMAAGVKRFIHMSALGTRPDARSRYHQSKWEGELLVLWSGLDWTIFRPSVIYGPRDRSINTLAWLMQSPFGLFPNLGGGWGRVQPISVGEVAHCIAHSVSDPRTLKIVYAPSGPYSLHWREVFGIIAHALGKNYVYDENGGLFVLRKLVWFFALVLPIAILGLAFTGLLTFKKMALLAILWLAAVGICANWRTLIFFRVPLRPLIALADFTKGWMPRWLQFGEQLKMLQEDNEADPRPSAEMFNFTPTPFAEGLAIDFKSSPGRPD